MQRSSYSLYPHTYIENPGYYNTLYQYCQSDPNMYTSNYKFTLPLSVKRKYQSKPKNPEPTPEPEKEVKEMYKDAPKVWGPEAWNFLHRCSFAYSDKPTPAQQRAARKFFRSLPEMLPCDICSEHCKTKIKKMPPQTKNKDSLSRWLVSLHNEVNKSLNKPQFSYEQAKKKYQSNTFCKV